MTKSTVEIFAEFESNVKMAMLADLLPKIHNILLESTIKEKYIVFISALRDYVKTGSENYLTQAKFNDDLLLGRRIMKIPIVDLLYSNRIDLPIVFAEHYNDAVTLFGEDTTTDILNIFDEMVEVYRYMEEIKTFKLKRELISWSMNSLGIKMSELMPLHIARVIAFYVRMIDG